MKAHAARDRGALGRKEGLFKQGKDRNGYKGQRGAHLSPGSAPLHFFHPAQSPNTPALGRWDTCFETGAFTSAQPSPELQSSPGQTQS